MAFSKDGLMLVGGSKAGNAPQMWTYKTNDTAATVDTSGYFNDVASLLKVGDVIYAHADADGTPSYGFHVVTANDGTTVDVTDATAVGGTDTD